MFKVLKDAFNVDLTNERKTWKTHTILFDPQARSICLHLLDKYLVGEDLYLCKSSATSIAYNQEQWYVSNGPYNIGFHMNQQFRTTVIISERVETTKRFPTAVVGICEMSDKIRYRMLLMLGMMNFSHCLRNSEHVANYMFNGKWLCSRTGDISSNICSFFGTAFLESGLANRFPSSVAPLCSVPKAKIYTFINSSWTPMDIHYYLDSPSDHNTLFIGLPGAGKSLLINVLFNQDVCSSEAGHRRVSDELYFVRGHRPIAATGANETIIVADTMSLCDKWFSKENLRNMENRISKSCVNIDAVYVVFQANRLDKIQVREIQQALSLFGYHSGTSRERFVFVGTHAEHLALPNRKRLSVEAAEVLGIESPDAIIYTGFAPEEDLNDKTTKIVMSDYMSLVESTTRRYKSAPIQVPTQSQCAQM